MWVTQRSKIREQLCSLFARETELCLHPRGRRAVTCSNPSWLWWTWGIVPGRIAFTKVHNISPLPVKRERAGGRRDRGTRRKKQDKTTGQEEVREGVLFEVMFTRKG